MSETRITSLGERLDLDIMERTAVKMGWQVWKNITCRGQKCELVIKKPGGYYEIGFKHGERNTDVVHDDWQGHAERDLQTIMPRYKETLFLDRTYISGFVETNRIETSEEIVVRVSR